MLQGTKIQPKTLLIQLADWFSFSLQHVCGRCVFYQALRAICLLFFVAVDKRTTTIPPNPIYIYYHYTLKKRILQKVEM